MLRVAFFQHILNLHKQLFLFQIFSTLKYSLILISISKPTVTNIVFLRGRLPGTTSVVVFGEDLHR